MWSAPAGTAGVPNNTIESAKYNALVADLTTLANEARPISAGGTGASTVSDALNNLGLNATQYLSNRNVIINGSGRINQRAYTSGAAASGANEYTLDRWRVVTSGQSLTFTGTDAGRTMTAPAGGVEQVIEGASIVGGTYTISFTGTATCTVDGVTKASGDTVTLTANTNATVRFSGGTFTDVQLELGSVATPLERRPVGTELSLCQRYYEKGFLQLGGYVQTGIGPLARIIFASSKRIAPSVSLSNLSALGAVSTLNFNTAVVTTDGLTFQAGSGTGNGGFVAGANFAADAEI